MSTPVPPSSPKTTVTTPTGGSSSGASLKTPSAPTPSSVLTTPSTTPKPTPEEPEAKKNEESQAPVKPGMQKENQMEDPFSKWLLLLFKMLFGRGGAILGAVSSLLYVPGKLIDKATGKSGLLNFSRSLAGGNKTEALAEQEKEYRKGKKEYKQSEDRKVATEAKKETNQAMQLGTAEKTLADQQKNNTGGSPLQAPDYANTVGNKASPVVLPAPTPSNASKPAKPANP